MKSQDIAAINTFVPKTHLFAIKKEKDGESHLELIPASRWNRFRRHFSCSNASMDRVKLYVTNAHLFQNPPAKLQLPKLELFQQKIQSYQNHQARSFCSRLYAKICYLFSCLICCRKKPTPVPPPQEQPRPQNKPNIALPEQPQQPAPQKSTSCILPSDPNLKKKAVANRKAFWEKFAASVPKRSFSGNQYAQNIADSAYFKAECARSQAFLSAQPATLAKTPDADLVYVCMGHGDVDEQVWPGFVLEQLQNGKAVHTLLFEHYHCAYGASLPAILLLDQEYGKYDKADGCLYAHLDRFSVHQFLCGLPRGKAESYADIPEGARKRYTSGMLPNTHWETRAQIDEVHTNFAIYIETVLKQGKKVVLADHSGALDLTDPLVKTYNELIKTYPNQLYFLWGWEGINRMTNQLITKKDTHPYTKTAIWDPTVTPQSGLNRCRLY